LIKDAKVDCNIKNKFGYNASDIAQDLNIRNLFGQLMGNSSAPGKEGGQGGSYGRSAFGGVLLHNDRVSKLKKLMHNFGEVNK